MQMQGQMQQAIAGAQCRPAGPSLAGLGGVRYLSLMTTTTDRTRDSTLERIKAALGPKGWSDAPDVLEPLLVDGRGLYKGRAALVAFPQSTAEVALLVTLCAEGGIAM